MTRITQLFKAPGGLFVRYLTLISDTTYYSPYNTSLICTEQTEGGREWNSGE